MYGLEESDHATVPMKLLNKEGQLSAEAVEGRAWPKENIARPNTFPTQSWSMRVPGGRAVCGGCQATGIPTANVQDLFERVEFKFVSWYRPCRACARSMCRPGASPLFSRAWASMIPWCRCPRHNRAMSSSLGASVCRQPRTSRRILLRAQYVPVLAAASDRPRDPRHRQIYGPKHR